MNNRVTIGISKEDGQEVIKQGRAVEFDPKNSRHVRMSGNLAKGVKPD